MKRRNPTNTGMSPNRSPTKKRTIASSPNRTTKDDLNTTEKAHDGLQSPTSVTMQNSFIIKNADESFDVYFQQMKKRKNQSNQAEHTAHPNESNFGMVAGKKPTARDGHSAVVDSQGNMFVFGGDRHHMPFNDLYMIRLE
jgi:hypothetical protein